MNLRRHLLESATLVLAAVAIAVVANTLASRERKLKLPGDYPNAMTVPTATAGAPSAPEQIVPAASSPATAQQGSGGSSSRMNRGPTAAPAEPRGTVGTPVGLSPSKKTPGDDVSPAPPSAATDLLSRFPPHPEKPWVEISGEDAGSLFAAGVPFLDARRTSDYAAGHVAGARPFSVWESDVDEKVMTLLGERDGRQPLVLYCSGGDCEDSHLLAQKLWGAGFNNNLVYRDGFPDWETRGGAVRSGAKR